MGAGHNESISEIAKDPLKGGADGAYQQLRHEVGQTGSFDNDAAKQRMAEATADMVSSGILPQMSAAWLKNEFSRIDTSGNGQIERAELQAAKEGQTRFGAFDGTFANAVDEELFDKLAKYDQRNGEENISKSALNRYLRRDDRENQRAIDKEEAKDALAPLYEGPDPLINYLNKDGNRRVSRHEMKGFLDDYEKFQGTGPYTEENAKFVKDLMHRDIPELHTGITTGFSARHTAKEMGLDSAHDRKHKDFSLAQEEYNNERPSERIPERPVGVATESSDSTPPPVVEQQPVSGNPVETYSVKKGDSIWEIAESSLKAHDNDVTESEIKRQVREITEINGLDKNGRTPDLIYQGESLIIPPLYDTSSLSASDTLKHDNGTVREGDEVKPVDTTKPGEESKPGENSKPTEGDNAKPSDNSNPNVAANAVGDGNVVGKLSTDSVTDVGISSFNSDHQTAQIQGWMKEMERTFGQLKNSRNWNDIRRNLPHRGRPHVPPIHPPFNPQIHY